MKRSAQNLYQIPDKVYFRIGEVSHLVGVDTHVLRYWESEFSLIKPVRSKSKHRLYRRQDVEFFFRVRSLLHEDGYTISGAKKYLNKLNTRNACPSNNRAFPTELGVDAEILTAIKYELRHILIWLDANKK